MAVLGNPLVFKKGLTLISSFSGIQTSSIALQSQVTRSSSTGTTDKPGKADSAGRPPPPPPPPPSSGTGTDAKSLFDALLANDDANDDGQISVDEAESSPVADLLSQAFGTIDTDADGQLTKDEMTLAASNGVLAPSGGDRPEGPGRVNGGPPQGAPQGPPPGEATGNQASSATSLYESLFNALTADQGTEQTNSLSTKLAQQMMDALELI